MQLHLPLSSAAWICGNHADHRLYVLARPQSQVYRGIIDDVINNVRQDFEEMGIEKEVLEELQRVSLHDHRLK
jgi:hypothetical protein